MDQKQKILFDSIMAKQKVHRLYNFLNTSPLSVPEWPVKLVCSSQNGRMEVPVSNEKCRKDCCQFDIYEAIDMIIKNEQTNMIKCKMCEQFLDANGFYVDSDLYQAIQTLETNYLKEYELLTSNCLDEYEVRVDRKNTYFLYYKNNQQRIIIKKSDMETEYDLDYKTYPSKQTPMFYENGWVFVHENVDVMTNNKLQAVLYLFFPSLAQSRWKEVQVFVNSFTKQQAYFQLCMSVSKMFNKQTGQHSILASGGLGFPVKRNYEALTFEVPLFTDDPSTQVPATVDYIKHAPMRTPRVFHQLLHLQGKVYALGGYMRDNQADVDVPLRSCERFDSVTKKWEDISALSSARQLFSALVYFDKIYVFGGKVVNKNTLIEEEDFTVEIFDPISKQWTLFNVLNKQPQMRYFNERPYSFVRDNHTIVIFGGRKDKDISDKSTKRSLQAAELDITTSKYTLTEDVLSEPITFEGFTDSQAIYYNNRFIFGFKKQTREYLKDILTPSICKYNTSSTNKFLIETFKKIVI